MNIFNKTKDCLFITDIIMLNSILCFAVIIFYFVLFQITLLKGTNAIRYMILIIAVLTTLSFLWATVEVMLHLSRNKERIYKEDLIFQKLIQDNKRV